VALSPLVTPSKPAVWAHVATLGRLTILLPTPCVLTPLLAGATAAHETGAPRGASRHGRSAPPPSPVYRAATVWPSRSRGSTRA